jgi:DNA-binding NarL/FixJ family response regulator
VISKELAVKHIATCNRIFLVDDQPCVLAGIVAIIDGDKSLNVVGTAQTGKQAIEEIGRHKPDLAVVELSLPDINGLDLLEEIHKVSPTTKTLVLTFREETSLMEQAINAGASGFVAKRSAGADLIHAMKAVLAGGVYLEPRLAGKYIMAPAAIAGSPPASLSQRELEVIKLVARGYSNKEISAQLSLSIKTIETYRARALEKLGTGTRARLVDMAMREGWMDA